MCLLVQPPSNKLHTALVSCHVFCNAYTVVRRALVQFGLSPDGVLLSLSPQSVNQFIRQNSTLMAFTSEYFTILVAHMGLQKTFLHNT